LKNDDFKPKRSKRSKKLHSGAKTKKKKKRNASSTVWHHYNGYTVKTSPLGPVRDPVAIFHIPHLFTNFIEQGRPKRHRNRKPQEPISGGGVFRVIHLEVTKNFLQVIAPLSAIVPLKKILNLELYFCRKGTSLYPHVDRLDAKGRGNTDITKTKCHHSFIYCETGCKVAVMFPATFSEAEVVEILQLKEREERPALTAALRDRVLLKGGFIVCLKAHELLYMKPGVWHYVLTCLDSWSIGFCVTE